MDITSNEIRTGNLFQYFIGEEGCEWDTTKLDWQDIKWCEEENGNFNKVHKSIKLTEDWLLNFGFKREEKTPSKEHGHYFSKWVMDYKYSFAYAPFREDWGFYHSYTDAPKDEDNDRFDFISCGIKYVHELQNLYFALTKTELVLQERGEKV